MKDTKNTPQIEWERGDFLLYVTGGKVQAFFDKDYIIESGPQMTVLQVKDNDSFIFNAPHDHADIMQAVFQWLRDVDQETRMKFIAGLVLEHQISYHLNTHTEEERLKSANMQDDDLFPKIYQAIKDVQKTVMGKKEYIEVNALYTLLDARGMMLPPYVVYMALKSIECLKGSLVDVGEGFFSVRGKL